MPRRGFTLIELLIVIAIILILIAIALPNFMEAQIRARVAKVQGEHKSLQTAIEEYRTDWPMYPWYELLMGIEPSSYTFIRRPVLST